MSIHSPKRMNKIEEEKKKKKKEIQKPSVTGYQKYVNKMVTIKRQYTIQYI
jgi:hypothetical protein